MSILTSLRDSPAPAVAVEIGSRGAAAASLEWRGGQPVVAAHAFEPLPEGALTPSLTAANAHDRAAVVGALTRLLEKVGRPRRIGLILPDVVAKVSRGLGEAMVGINVDEIPQPHRLAERGW